jgi:hypothetical protein
MQHLDLEPGITACGWSVVMATHEEPAVRRVGFFLGGPPVTPRTLPALQRTNWSARLHVLLRKCQAQEINPAFGYCIPETKTVQRARVDSVNTCRPRSSCFLLESSADLPSAARCFCTRNDRPLAEVDGTYHSSCLEWARLQPREASPVS